MSTRLHNLGVFILCSFVWVGCERRVWIEQTSLRVDTYVFEDRTRTTPGLGGAEELAARELELWIWSGTYRGYGDERPLLFLAHGGGGHPEKFDAFAQEIANAGLLVAAIKFPLTNAYAPVELVYGVVDTSNQPADVSASIDWLLAGVTNRKHELYRSFNTEQLTYLGHSLGGQTGLALSRYSCCLEQRFQAWILAAPFLLLNDTLFPGHVGTIPSEGPRTLFLHGLADPIAPVDDTLEVYETIEPAKAFVGLSETGHSEYLEALDGPTTQSHELAQELTLAALSDWFMGQPGRLEQALEEAADDGHDVLFEW